MLSLSVPGVLQLLVTLYTSLYLFMLRFPSLLVHLSHTHPGSAFIPYELYDRSHGRVARVLQRAMFQESLLIKIDQHFGTVSAPLREFLPPRRLTAPLTVHH